MRRPLIAALLLLPTMAVAQQPAPPVPEWNVQAHCERQNRIMATESAFMLRSCIDLEDRSQRMVRAQWDALAPAVRRTCLNQQRALRMASYFMLNACIELEAGAMQDLEGRRQRG